METAFFKFFLAGLLPAIMVPGYLGAMSSIDKATSADVIYPEDGVRIGDISNHYDIEGNFVVSGTIEIISDKAKTSHLLFLEVYDKDQDVVAYQHLLCGKVVSTVRRVPAEGIDGSGDRKSDKAFFKDCNGMKMPFRFEFRLIQPPHDISYFEILTVQEHNRRAKQDLDKIRRAAFVSRYNQEFSYP